MSLFNGLRVQARVTHALVLREIVTRYGIYKAGFLWAFFEPIIHIATFVVIFTAIGRAVTIGDNIFIFILTGIIPWLLFNHIVSQVMSGLVSNQALLSYPHVMPIDIALARTILEFVTLALVFLLFLAFALQFNLYSHIDNILGLIGCVFIIVLFSFGLGILNASISLYLPSFDRIFRNAMRPMYFVSGIFYTADSLPAAALEYLYYNPILHMVEWFRSDFYESYDSYSLDKNYLYMVTLSLLFIGLIVERASRKYARQAKS